jgi:hypothetical protein
MSPFPGISTLSLGSIVRSSKGATQIPILAEAKPVCWQPSESREVPFEPSAFEDKESAR